MPSWVRYSVAVYVGLLLAGSLMASKQASAWNWGSQQPRAMVRAEQPREAPTPRVEKRDTPQQIEPERKQTEPPQRAG